MTLPSTSAILDPKPVLEAGGLQPGMSAADFGCGTLGHFVFAASRIVGDGGKVYAVDIMKSCLAAVESRMKLENVGNVVTIWADIERYGATKIPDNALDVGLVVNNIFLAKDRLGLMKECSRMVKKGGRVVVVEWKPGVKGLGPEDSRRVPPEEALRLAAQAGLTLERQFEPGPYHYGFVCLK